MIAPVEPDHRVVLDANLFFHPTVRDILLVRAREARLIEVCWSPAILAEVERNWARVTGAERATERWQRLLSALRPAFPAALVSDTPSPPAAGSPGVPPEDWHVIGTALAARPTGIVTLNRRPFPARTLERLGLRVWSPDTLCLDLYECAGERMVATLISQGARLHRPRSLSDTLAVLASQCPRFVARVRADRRPG